MCDECRPGSRLCREVRSDNRVQAPAHRRSRGAEPLAQRVEIAVAVVVVAADHVGGHQERGGEGVRSSSVTGRGGRVSAGASSTEVRRQKSDCWPRW